MAARNVINVVLRTTPRRILVTFSGTCSMFDRHPCYLERGTVYLCLVLDTMDWSFVLFVPVHSRTGASSHTPRLLRRYDQTSLPGSILKGLN